MKILLSGCTGAMGRVITEVCQSKEGYEIVAGFAISDTGDLPYPVYTDIQDVREEVDVVIDFSNVDALASVLDFGVRRKVPLVIATTGLGDDEHEKIRQAAQEVPILQSGNMSLGVNTLLYIVEKLAASLGDFDIEVVEKHHRYKVDAPSGTAQMLAEAARKGRQDIDRLVYGREGGDTKRQDGELGIHSIRGGTIVGEHSVIFAGEDEIVEIKHTALSKKVFAHGAFKAADFIIGQKAGLYRMEDVMG